MGFWDAVASAGPYANNPVQTDYHTTHLRPHHSTLYDPDALPDAQPTASKHWRQTKRKEIRLNHFKPHKLLDTSHCASSVDSATLRSSARLNFCRKPSHSSFSNNMFCCTALQTTIYSSSWRFFLHFSKIKLWKQSHTWNAYSSSEIDKNCCILKFHLNCCTWKGNGSCMLIRPLQDCSKNPVILYMFQHLCQCHINKTGFTFSLL